MVQDSNKTTNRRICTFSITNYYQDYLNNFITTEFLAAADG